MSAQEAAPAKKAPRNETNTPFTYSQNKVDGYTAGSLAVSDFRHDFFSTRGDAGGDKNWKITHTKMLETLPECSKVASKELCLAGEAARKDDDGGYERADTHNAMRDFLNYSLDKIKELINDPARFAKKEIDEAKKIDDTPEYKSSVFNELEYNIVVLANNKYHRAEGFDGLLGSKNLAFVVDAYTGSHFKKLIANSSRQLFWIKNRDTDFDPAGKPSPETGAGQEIGLSYSKLGDAAATQISGDGKRSVNFIDLTEKDDGFTYERWTKREVDLVNKSELFFSDTKIQQLQNADGEAMIKITKGNDEWTLPSVSIKWVNYHIKNIWMKSSIVKFKDFEKKSIKASKEVDAKAPTGIHPESKSQFNTIISAYQSVINTPISGFLTMAKRLGDQGQALSCLRFPPGTEHLIPVFVTHDQFAFVAAIMYNVDAIVYLTPAGEVLFVYKKYLDDPTEYLKVLIKRYQQEMSRTEAWKSENRGIEYHEGHIDKDALVTRVENLINEIKKKITEEIKKVLENTNKRLVAPPFKSKMDAVKELETQYKGILTGISALYTDSTDIDMLTPLQHALTHNFPDEPQKSIRRKAAVYLDELAASGEKAIPKPATDKEVADLAAQAKNCQLALNDRVSLFSIYKRLYNIDTDISSRRKTDGGGGDEEPQKFNLDNISFKPMVADLTESRALIVYGVLTKPLQKENKPRAHKEVGKILELTSKRETYSGVGQLSICYNIARNGKEGTAETLQKVIQTIFECAVANAPTKAALARTMRSRPADLLLKKDLYMEPSEWVKKLSNFINAQMKWEENPMCGDAGGGGGGGGERVLDGGGEGGGGGLMEADEDESEDSEDMSVAEVLHRSGLKEPVMVPRKIKRGGDRKKKHQKGGNNFTFEDDEIIRTYVGIVLVTMSLLDQSEEHLQEGLEHFLGKNTIKNAAEALVYIEETALDVIIVDNPGPDVKIFSPTFYNQLKRLNLGEHNGVDLLQYLRQNILGVSNDPRFIFTDNIADDTASMVAALQAKVSESLSNWKAARARAQALPAPPVEAAATEPSERPAEVSKDVGRRLSWSDDMVPQDNFRRATAGMAAGIAGGGKRKKKRTRRRKPKKRRKRSKKKRKPKKKQTRRRKPKKKRTRRRRR